MFKRKRTTDEEARIIANLVGQQDSIWNQLTDANARLAAADDRYRDLERVCDLLARAGGRIPQALGRQVMDERREEREELAEIERDEADDVREQEAAQRFYGEYDPAGITGLLLGEDA